MAFETSVAETAISIYHLEKLCLRAIGIVHRPLHGLLKTNQILFSSNGLSPTSRRRPAR